MAEHGDALLQLETEIDRRTIARQHARHARRPPRDSDRLWALGIGLVGVTGWLATGPSLLWWLCLAATGLFLVGDLVERRAVARDLEAIPEDERRRVVTIGESGVTVTAGSGAVLLSGPWREVDAVRRVGRFYTLVVRDEPVEIPLDAFPSELARGSFEAVCARNDRPVLHD